MAIMQLPKAMDPKWYLKIHLTPIQTDPLPLVSPEWEKYQTHDAAAMTN